MKKQSILTTTLLALAGFGLFTAETQAATTTYSNGDLFIGFYDATNNSSSDFLYNIGTASIYRDATNGATISLGNVGSTLVSLFGSDWNTNQDIRWFVWGTTRNATVGADVPWTLYAGQERVLIGTQGTPYAVGSTDTQGVIAGSMQAAAVAFRNQNSSLGSNMLIQNINASNSLKSLSNTITLFDGTYVTGGFGDGATNTVLDLFRMRGDLDSANGELGTYEGKFTINASGVITYTAPVPEPSTYGLVLGAGAILLVAIRRMRKVRAA